MNGLHGVASGQEAGVSVHVVHGCLLRGLLYPATRTANGYGVFDVAALQRLCFVRATFETGSAWTC